MNEQLQQFLAVLERIATALEKLATLGADVKAGAGWIAAAVGDVADNVEGKAS